MGRGRGCHNGSDLVLNKKAFLPEFLAREIFDFFNKIRPKYRMLRLGLRSALTDMGYDVALPASAEAVSGGTSAVSGTTPLETTSTPSEAPAPGEISAPDGAVATAVANKPASQRFWETKPRPPEAVTGEDYLGPDEVAMPVDDSLPPDQVRAPQ